MLYFNFPEIKNSVNSEYKHSHEGNLLFFSVIFGKICWTSINLYWGSKEKYFDKFPFHLISMLQNFFVFFAAISQKSMILSIMILNFPAKNCPGKFSIIENGQGKFSEM